ncbi:putative phosphoglycerate mutase family protein [Russula earlei]|uniref:Phosphoglycerate mutase family protein n=1 Tax=Russula earlei TaxID=71964 RepID=A0ACC0UAY0_9AGAM|nr:putative phosphoglycerate mutase family protein [Russula earlei]
MGWFDNDHQYSQDYDNYQSGPKHESSVTHELIAGAASYEAAKAYEDHVARNGQPDSHAKAKELIAGFAGAFVDKEFETHGLDFIDREKAKYQAKKQAEEAVTQYGGYGGGDY